MVYCARTDETAQKERSWVVNIPIYSCHLTCSISRKMACSEDRIGAGDAEANPQPALCAICMHQFRDPRLFQCFHSFCKGCIDDLVVREGHKHELACPVCRRVTRLTDLGAAALPKDITRSFQRALECETCSHLSEQAQGHEPEMLCSVCELVFCKEHIAAHLIANIGHNARALSKETQAQAKLTDSASAPGLCPEHKKPLLYFCKAPSCNVPACGDCTAIGAHHKHTPIVRILAVVEEKRTRLRSKLSRLRDNHLSRVERSIATVEKVTTHLMTTTERVRTEIQAARQRAVDRIDEVAARKLADVEDVEQARLKVLHGQHDDLVRQRTSAQSAFAFGEKLVARDDQNETMCELLTEMKRRVDEIDDAGAAETPAVHPYLVLRKVNEDDLLAKANCMIGEVRSHPASAEKSVIDGRSQRTCVVDCPVKFKLIGRDAYSGATTEGGDAVRASFAEVPHVAESMPALLKVIDTGDGAYEILCTPHYVGWYSVQVEINGQPLKETLGISCVYMTFDSRQCHQGNSISEDLRAVTHTGKCSDASVLGCCTMSQGYHVWRVQVVKSLNMDVAVGIIKKLGLAVKEATIESSYSWWGKNGRKCAKGGWEASISRWNEYDVLELEFDGREHILSITNLRSGESDSMDSLPAVEFLPYFCLYDQEDQLRLLR